MHADQHSGRLTFVAGTMTLSMAQLRRLQDHSALVTARSHKETASIPCGGFASRRQLAELVEHIMMLCCARDLGFVENRCDQAFRASPDG